ncbi:MAG: hypothetical protein ABEI74_02370 [Candidatus Pacearchaeota archaeon]
MVQENLSGAKIRHRRGNLDLEIENTKKDRDYLSIGFPGGNLTYSIREAIENPLLYFKSQCENHENFVQFLEYEKNEVDEILNFVDNDLLNVNQKVFESYKIKIAEILGENSSALVNYQLMTNRLRKNLDLEKRMIDGYSILSETFEGMKEGFEFFHKVSGGNPHLNEYARLITNSYEDIGNLFSEIISGEQEIIDYN